MSLSGPGHIVESSAAASTVVETAVIHAPLERVFGLSTRIELVQQTLGMKPVSGVTSGHISAGSRVAWRGWKFGLPTEHHTLITAFESPQTIALPSGPARAAFFQDTQERGRFAAFHHDHFFREETVDGEPQTMLRDEVHFTLPFGALGKLVAKAFMATYIRNLAQRRFAMIKVLAEGEGWREWLADERDQA
jgi:ligand-binding SRPBCC domain-containing protein